MHRNPAIATRPKGDPDRAIDRHREHEAVVVVGVIADEVHAPRTARDEGRGCAMPLRERTYHALARTAGARQHHALTHRERGAEASPGAVRRRAGIRRGPRTATTD